MWRQRDRNDGWEGDGEKRQQSLSVERGSGERRRRHRNRSSRRSQKGASVERDPFPEAREADVVGKWMSHTPLDLLYLCQVFRAERANVAAPGAVPGVARSSFRYVQVVPTPFV